jgi:hypothetical protein
LGVAWFAVRALDLDYFMNKIKHLPYQIDPDKNRNAYYETLWKEKALELLAKHEPELNGWNLLDYGSGRGETLMLAAKLGMRVKGTDLDPECVRLSSAFGESVELDVADPVAQLGRKAYDVVTCFHVLEHVPSPVATLGHLTQMARRYVLLAVPNGCMMPDLLRPRRNVYEINEGHLQNWDHSHLLNLAERHCGLKLVEWTFDHVKLPIFSNQICKRCGQKAAIYFETGLFKRLFPFQSTSIIGLFRVL